MCAQANRPAAVVVLAALLLIAGLARPGFATEALDICSLVSSEQLAALHRKPLYPKSQENGCYWSREPGTMAYLHIGVLESTQPLRQYFHPQLSATTTLEPIIDLGDEGLMSVVEGEVGVNPTPTRLVPCVFCVFCSLCCLPRRSGRRSRPRR